MKTIKNAILFIFFSCLVSCVQETHQKTITFKVDMNGIENVKKVGIRGNFTADQWMETLPLTDFNDDGIYEGTFSEKTAASQIQFKFVNQGGDYELKNIDNRIIQFKYQPEIILYEAIFNDPNGKQTLKNK